MRVKIILITAALAGIGLLAWGVNFFRSWYEAGVHPSVPLSWLASWQPSSNTPSSSVSLWQRALGWEEPRAYLVLFLNNTELRPGGGFIGAYGLVEMNKGIPRLALIEGTERLGSAVSGGDLPAPPEPLERYLKVKRWYFRDSNWSPDFAESSRQGLDLLEKQRGKITPPIAGVIAFTPRVMEDIIRLTGPLEADGQRFTSDNFTERLQYEVEYGYASRGQSFDERKNIMRDLGQQIFKRLERNIIKNWRVYWQLGAGWLREKQVMVFAVDPAEQAIVRSKGWSGELLGASAADYLLWVDANLGALKTDRAIERSLRYEIRPDQGKFIATATMEYRHRGGFDWRTSRYRDYVRVFVPLGSHLTAVSGTNVGKGSAISLKDIGSGTELNRQWFGAFLAVEPGATTVLSFTYQLPGSLTQLIKSGAYRGTVQKQLGTIHHGLTLDFDFGKTVVTTTPPNQSKQRARYQLTTDLSVDREFSVKF